MSELSAEEKKRLLRERRQAKMSQGKATERLNNILTKGSSVNSTAVKSVLDQDPPISKLALAKLDPHVDVHHDDPEVSDISLLLQQESTKPAVEENDMEALMQKLFGGGGLGDGEGKNTEESSSNFLAEMMKTMQQDPNAIPETPENASYQTKLAAYQQYQQRAWKARFIMIRYLMHMVNFFYHFHNFPGFGASSNVLVRSIRPVQGVGNFMTFFISAEIAIISSYFMILSSSGLLRQSSRNHLASKMLSMAAAVFPQAAAYQSLLDSILVYWEGVSIILGDVMFVVVLFGIVSILF